MYTKWIAAVCTISCSISCFQLNGYSTSDIHPQSVVEKGLPKVGHEEAVSAWLFTLRSYIATREWHLLGLMSRAAMAGGVTIKEIQQLGFETECDPLVRAIHAVNRINDLPGNVHISKGDLLRITLFIETEMSAAREKLGNYMTRRKTGLERTIEYDPLTGDTFIHLDTHGQKEIARDDTKVITKSILYDAQKPQIVACITTTARLDGYIDMLQRLKKKRGIFQMLTETKRSISKEASSYNLLCRRYRGGSLAEFLKGKRKLSLKQKLKVALDLVSGLESVHKLDLVHRNIATNTLFIDYRPNGKHKVRNVKAAIAKFDNVHLREAAIGIQPHRDLAYYPPDGVVYEKMEPVHYIHADVYALGCVLFQLVHGKKAPWIDTINLQNPTQPQVVREAKFLYDINRYQKSRLSRLVKKSKTSLEISPKLEFEKLILKMTNPNPDKRGTTTHIRQILVKIIKEHQKQHTPNAVALPQAPKPIEVKESFIIAPPADLQTATQALTTTPSEADATSASSSSDFDLVGQTAASSSGSA